MIRPIVYIIFALLLAFAISIATIMACLCKKWREAYLRLIQKYEKIYSENIRFQHEIYKLTYITPSVDTKKGKNGNGTK